MATKCRFSFRQRQILWGKIAGLQNKEIADLLGIAPTTINVIIHIILGKMRRRCNSHAARAAFLSYLHENSVTEME